MPYNLMAKAGIDLSSHDRMAQAAGVPMHAVLGGKRLERVPLIGVVDIVSNEKAGLCCLAN